MKEAIKKIEKELNDFRVVTKKKKADDVYRLSVLIMFTEATAQYTMNLLQLNMTNLSEHVMNENATLQKCTDQVINMAKRKGTLGSVTLEEFQNEIIGYYNLDHDEIRRQEEIAEKEKEAEAKEKHEKLKKLRDKKNKTTKIENNPLDDGPDQMTLFGGVVK